MSTILRSQIIDEITQCPYCGSEIETDPHRGCCGEVHSERAYLTETESYPVDETTVIEDEPQQSYAELLRFAKVKRADLERLKRDIEASIPGVRVVIPGEGA